MKITVINKRPTGGLNVYAVDGCQVAPGASHVMSGREESELVFQMAAIDADIAVIGELEGTERAPLVCTMKTVADPASSTSDEEGFDLLNEAGTAAGVAPQMYVGVFDDADCLIPSTTATLTDSTGDATGTIDDGDGTNLLLVTPDSTGEFKCLITKATYGKVYLKAWSNSSAYIIDCASVTDSTFFLSAISDVDTDEAIYCNQQNVVITGTGFCSPQGTGKVELCDNISYAAATKKITQTIDTWAATSIQFDTIQSTLVPGSIWMFVTNSQGSRNAVGIAMTLVAEVPTITDIDIDEAITTTQEDVVLTGTNLGAEQGTGKLELCDNATYGSATEFVEQTVSAWGATEITFDVVQGTLSPGNVYAFVTNANGGINATGLTVALS